MSRKPIHKRSGLFFALILLGVLAALWWGLGFAEQARQNGAEEADETDVSNILDERGELSVPADERGQNADERGSDRIGEAPSDFRQDVIATALSRATAILPESGGGGSVQRFWFYADREVYVEYATSGSGTVNRMAFLVVTGDSPNLALARRAFYGQGESGIWELLEGDEVLFSKSLRDLYERDSRGEWESRN